MKEHDPRQSQCQTESSHVNHQLDSMRADIERVWRQSGNLSDLGNESLAQYSEMDLATNSEVACDDQTFEYYRERLIAALRGTVQVSSDHDD